MLFIRESKPVWKIYGTQILNQLLKHAYHAFGIDRVFAFGLIGKTVGIYFGNRPGLTVQVYFKFSRETEKVVYEQVILIYMYTAVPESQNIQQHCRSLFEIPVFKFIENTLKQNQL